HQDDVRALDRCRARPGAHRRDEEPGAEHLHQEGRAQEDVRLPGRRALEHGDQDLSGRRAVLEVRQGKVPEDAALQPRLPALQVRRLMGQAVLELRALAKHFGGLHAVRNVALEILPGERRAVIGPNGAGKTTLFNLITGVFPSSSGRILLFGRDVTRWPSHRRTALGMARTFQITSLFPKLSVLENVLLAIGGLRRTKFVMWRALSSYRELHEKARRLLEDAG